MITKTTSKAKNTVSFLEKDSIHEVESRDQYSQLERINTWYTLEEINRMKERSVRQAQREAMLASRMIHDTDRERRNFVHAVLKFQKHQQKPGRHRNHKTPPDEAIASKCSSMSHSHRKAAYVYGTFDASTAAHIYRSDGMLPTSGSARKSKRIKVKPVTTTRRSGCSNLSLPKIRLPTALIR